MSVEIKACDDDLVIFTLSELTRVLNVPVSRMNKAIKQGRVSPRGFIGHTAIMVLTETELETLRTELHTQDKHASTL